MNEDFDERIKEKYARINALQVQQARIVTEINERTDIDDIRKAELVVEAAEKLQESIQKIR